MLHVAYALPISKVSKRDLRSSGWVQVSNATHLEKTVERLFGHSLRNPRIVESVWHSNPAVSGIPTSATLVRLKNANPVVVFQLDIDIEHLNLARNLKKLVDKNWSAALNLLGIKVDSEYSVDALVVSVASSDFPMDSLTRDGWSHRRLDGKTSEFDKTLVRELALRVSIEKAFLTWAMATRTKFFTNLAIAPYSAFRIRRMPVELLIDRKSIQDAYQTLRNELNLSNARQEVLARAKSWWASFLAIIAIVTFLVDWVRFLC